MSNEEADFLTGDGRRLNISDVAELYREVYNLSSPISGRIQLINRNNYSLICSFKAIDCDASEYINTFNVYSLTTAQKEGTSDKYIESVSCITDHQTSKEIARATSENGRFLARIRESENTPNASPSQFLEIWDRSKLLKTINISESDSHGNIITDSLFSTFCWSPFGAQDKLLYVCKTKKPVYNSFFKNTTVKLKESKFGDEKSNLPNFGQDFQRQEDWGETLKGIDHTIVSILDIETGFKITTLDIEGFSLAKPKWLDGLKTISVAYTEEPRRLGLIYCNNKPARLVVHDWTQSRPKEVLNLNSDTRTFYGPQASHCGRKFIYLSTNTYGAHKKPARLHLYDLDSNLDTELVDKTTNEIDHFFSESGEPRFSSDDKHILFVKNDHLYQHMCLYSLDSSSITKIKFPTTGIELLDFRYNLILAKGSEINATPTLYVSILNSEDSGELVAWHQIEECIHLDEIDYKPYEIPTSDGLSFVSAILISPNIPMLHKNFTKDPEQLITDLVAKTQYDLPTVVIIHGGPHATYLIEYMPACVFYNRLGLRVLLINYRGSTGVSLEYVENLLGKVGQLDVDDCLYVVRHFVNGKVINPEKLAIQGGSHGGFIACHLTCQDEFKFASAVMINPVTELISSHKTTDIPEWVLAVGLGHKTHDPKWTPDLKDLVKLYEASPMSKYFQSSVPTLMLLGSLDYRVNMSQGERWFELLKARGVKAQCKVYADSHQLPKAKSTIDRTISSGLWILGNLDKNKA